jgi:hypothetical protein
VIVAVGRLRISRIRILVVEGEQPVLAPGQVGLGRIEPLAEFAHCRSPAMLNSLEPDAI